MDDTTTTGSDATGTSAGTGAIAGTSADTGQTGTVPANPNPSATAPDASGATDNATTSPAATSAGDPATTLTGPALATALTTMLDTAVSLGAVSFSMNTTVAMPEGSATLGLGLSKLPSIPNAHTKTGTIPDMVAGVVAAIGDDAATFSESMWLTDGYYMAATLTHL